MIRQLPRRGQVEDSVTDSFVAAVLLSLQLGFQCVIHIAWVSRAIIAMSVSTLGSWLYEYSLSVHYFLTFSESGLRIESICSILLGILARLYGCFGRPCAVDCVIDCSHSIRAFVFDWFVDWLIQMIQSRAWSKHWGEAQRNHRVSCIRVTRLIQFTLVRSVVTDQCSEQKVLKPLVCFIHDCECDPSIACDVQICIHSSEGWSRIERFALLVVLFYNSLWQSGTLFSHSHTKVTWLILPVVICLFQRLSHACLSINIFIRWNCVQLIISVILSLMVPLLHG
jgi:hypothetical protein